MLAKSELVLLQHQVLKSYCNYINPMGYGTLSNKSIYHRPGLVDMGLGSIGAKEFMQKKT